MPQSSSTEHKQQIIAQFAATAAAYDANRALQACARRLVELAAPQPGERVLDVCCGTGNLALAAAQAVGPGGRVVGVDLTEAMLVQARRKAEERGLTNVEFGAGDAERLEVDDASFDVVLCGLGIMLVPDHAAAAREWYRALCPGGRVAVSTWRYGFTTPVLRQLLGARLARLGLDANSRANSAFQDPETSHRLLAGAGFVDVAVRTEQHGFHYSTFEEYWENDVLGTPIGVLIERLGPPLAAQVKEEHLAEVTATASPEGIWREGAVNLALGRKPPPGQ
jgi:SAM-dependent methyltransferase